jgi:sec-independent protein translocase protein TatB
LDLREAGTAIVSMVILTVPPTIQIASVGIPDTLFLMLLALVVFGPRRLPEIGRQIGKLMYEFRKVSNDFKFQMEEELRASEEADRQRKLAAAQTTQASATLDFPAQAVPDLAVPDQAIPDQAIADQPGLDQPVAEPSTLTVEPAASAGETEAAANIGAENAQAVSETAPAVEGEVRGEPRRFPQDQVEGQMQNALRVQPPTTGETIEAQRPFRGRQNEVTTESGDAPTKVVDAPIVVEDEGRIGTEVQPGVVSEAGTGREAHHG